MPYQANGLYLINHNDCMDNSFGEFLCYIGQPILFLNGAFNAIFYGIILNYNKKHTEKI